MKEGIGSLEKERVQKGSNYSKPHLRARTETPNLFLSEPLGIVQK